LEITTFENLLSFIGTFYYDVENLGGDNFCKRDTVLIVIEGREKRTDTSVNKITVKLLERRLVVEFTQAFGK